MLTLFINRSKLRKVRILRFNIKNESSKILQFLFLKSGILKTVTSKCRLIK